MVAKELPSIPSCSEFSRRVGVTGTMEEYLLRHLSSTSGAGKTFSGMNKAFAQCYASNITTTLCSFFDGIAGGANAPSTFLTAVMKRADGCAPGTAITCGASKLLDEGWAAMRRAWHFFGDFNPTDPIQVGTMCAVTLGASNFLLMGGTELIGAVASKAKDVARKLVTWARANIFASGQGYTANALIEAARALEGMETPVFARMRPTNPEAVRLLEEGALPKGQQFKSKTAKPIDLALGIEMGDEGKVVYFTPDPKGLGFKAWWKKRPAYIRSKFSNQMEAVEKAFNERIAEFAEQKKAMDALVNKGEIRIEKGVIYDTKTGKFHTGDNDIYDFVDAKGVRITDPKVIAEAQRRIARVLNVEHGGQKYWDMSQLTGEDLAKAQKIADRIELKHHRTEKLIVIGPGGKVRMTFDTDPLPADQIQRLQSYGEPALFQITD